MISFTKAMEIMDATDKKGMPVPFDIRFVSANKQTGKGGEVIELTQASMAAGTRGKSAAKNVFSGNGKNPQHFANATRNLVHNGKYVKVHIRLITQINGQDIIW